MKQLKYYLFCIKWLWNNRNWQNTRQKFKAMEKDFFKSKVTGKNKHCFACKYFAFYTGKSGICRATKNIKEAINICDCGCFKKKRR